jgi:predicted O-methyltransferase YrrM
MAKSPYAMRMTPSEIKMLASAISAGGIRILEIGGALGGGAVIFIHVAVFI